MFKYLFQMVTIASIIFSFTACDDTTSAKKEEEQGNSSSVELSSSTVNVSSSSNTSVSSSSVNVSSSSKTPVSSSSIKNSSSSSTSVSSSSAKVPSSSNASISSSSSVESTPYSYPEWNTCVSEGRCGTFTDSRETPTREYKWVKIGTQTWMAENLAYLPSVNEYSNIQTTNPKYYVFGYNGSDVAEAKASSNYKNYGALYNWTAAKDACPTGWHLPDTTEWNILAKYVGGKNTAATELKSISGWEPCDWSTTFKSGTDSYGFSALPGGFLQTSYDSGALGLGENGLRIYGVWWTATKNNVGDPYSNQMAFSENRLVSNNYLSYFGISVRCVKD